jgi:hypothetical protein
LACPLAGFIEGNEACCPRAVLRAIEDIEFVDLRRTKARFEIQAGLKQSDGNRSREAT